MSERGYRHETRPADSPGYGWYIVSAVVRLVKAFFRPLLSSLAISSNIIALETSALSDIRWQTIEMKSIAILAAVSVASAHTIFTQLQAGGTTYGVSYGIRDPSYDGPIQDVTSNSLACNGPPNPTTPSDKIINVTAGSEVKAIWRHTLTSGPDDVMDASHLGPTIAYLKKVDNALTDSGVGNGW